MTIVRQPAPAPWAGLALGLCALGVAQALLLVWGSAPGAQGEPLRQLAAVTASAVLGVCACAWVALERRFAQTPLFWILALAGLVRVISIQASPLLEDDYFRYFWDGLRTATALDPYRLPPAAFFGDASLPQTWQDVLSGINNPEVPTIYGPVLQGLFALAHEWAPARLYPLQVILLTVDMAVIGLLARQGLGARGLLIYALHPVLLKEAMASAHPDGLIALLLLMALWAWDKRRAALVGLAVGLAIGAKVAALVALPMLLLAPRPRALGPAGPPMPSGPWALPVLLWCGATVIVLYLPFLVSSGSDVPGLMAFAGRWRFNPLFFRWVELLTPTTLARPAAALLILAALVALVWRWRTANARASASLLPPLDIALAALILLSPVVNPWYWLWVIALSLRLGSGWIVAASMSAPLAYFNTAVLPPAYSVLAGQTHEAYVVAWPAVLLQFVVLGLAWVWRRRLQL